VIEAHEEKMNTYSNIQEKKAIRNLLMSKYGVASIAVFCSILWGSAFPVLKVTYEELALDIQIFLK